jgi:hypothetical protein
MYAWLQHISCQAASQQLQAGSTITGLACSMVNPVWLYASNLNRNPEPNKQRLVVGGQSTKQNSQQVCGNAMYTPGALLLTK